MIKLSLGRLIKLQKFGTHPMENVLQLCGGIKQKSSLPVFHLKMNMLLRHQWIIVLGFFKQLQVDGNHKYIFLFR